MTDISEKELDALASIVAWPRPVELMSDEHRREIASLSSTGLIWRKADYWTISEAGEAALMTDDHGSKRQWAGAAEALQLSALAG